MAAGSKPNEKDNTRKVKLITLKQTVRPLILETCIMASAYLRRVNSLELIKEAEWLPIYVQRLCNEGR
jgi:hypothetical protein